MDHNEIHGLPLGLLGPTKWLRSVCVRKGRFVETEAPKTSIKRAFPEGRFPGSRKTPLGFLWASQELIGHPLAASFIQQASETASQAQVMLLPSDDRQLTNAIPHHPACRHSPAATPIRRPRFAGARLGIDDRRSSRGGAGVHFDLLAGRHPQMQRLLRREREEEQTAGQLHSDSTLARSLEAPGP